MKSIKELNQKIASLKAEVKALELKYENSPNYSAIAGSILAKKRIIKEYRYLIKITRDHKKLLRELQEA